MSKIRSKDTKPEVFLRKALSAKGIRGYKKNVKLFGFEVDLIFPRCKLAIFCDSEFWHGYSKKIPQTNKKYWIPKLRRNKERDKLANKTLRKKGWRVTRLWEKKILENADRESDKIIAALRSSKTRRGRRPA